MYPRIANRTPPPAYTGERPPEYSEARAAPVIQESAENPTTTPSPTLTDLEIEFFGGF